MFLQKNQLCRGEKMLLEYLTKRKEILIYRLKENQDKLDHNLIAIVESKNKIEQMQSDMEMCRQGIR